METDTKTALFVGGNADGQLKDITEIEPRINWLGDAYISRGSLMTSKYGNIQLYILAEMKIEEEKQRIEIIKKVL